MFSKLESRIVLTSLLFLVPITGGLLAYTILEVQESKQFTNQVNGYVQPKWLGYVIDETQKSLVTVECGGSFGSGFSFSFDDTDLSNEFSFKSKLSSENGSFILTNAHVLESCRSSEAKISFERNSTGTARIIELDIENDLALLETSKSIPPLFGSYSRPWTGFWVMALGSPHSFKGSVTFGNIINRNTSLIFTTASLSPGNSGGPLIDNEGFVLGINSGSKPVGQNFNISIGINTLCQKIISCPDIKYWQEE